MENDIFVGLKSGQDLKNRAAHPHQEFPGVPPPPPGGHQNPSHESKYSQKNMGTRAKETLETFLACKSRRIAGYCFSIYLQARAAKRFLSFLEKVRTSRKIMATL